MIFSAFSFLFNIPEANAENDLVPQAFIQGPLKNYSAEEQALIQIDQHNIETLAFYQKTRIEDGQQPVYIATAGGPGAGKSTILENYLYDKENFVYTDPDPRTLKFMIMTYLQELTYGKISLSKSYLILQEKAYTKWRDASNYIATSILNKAFEGHYSIAHGTTSSNKAIENLYKKLKENGYKILLLLCAAPDETRQKAIEHRIKSQAFYQSTPEDVLTKGEAFLENFPIYFTYADEIEIYWTEDVMKGSEKTALFKRGKSYEILNHSAFEKFREFYKKKPLEKKAKEKLLPLDDVIKFMSYS